MIFFFKQKTAYEMRISDWSSDVCSSDLPAGRHGRRPLLGRLLQPHRHHLNHRREMLSSGFTSTQNHERNHSCSSCFPPSPSWASPRPRFSAIPAPWRRAERSPCTRTRAASAATARSEEHTSELPSLMRISYAVFCWKKKNKTRHHHDKRE